MWKASLLFLFISVKGHSQGGCKNFLVEKSFYIDSDTNAFDSIIYAKGFFDISLYESFDDSCLLFINDTLIINKHIKTNFSIGHTTERVFLSQPEDNSCIKLRIILVNRNICLTEYLDLSQTYRILAVYLHKKKNKWTLEYSNHIPMLE